MTALQAVMAVSAIVTALSALGAFEYVRRFAADAAWSRRALEGEEHSDGLIQTVERVEKRSRQNSRALRREGALPDGGTVQEASDE